MLKIKLFLFTYIYYVRILKDKFLIQYYFHNLIFLVLKKKWIKIHIMKFEFFK